MFEYFHCNKYQNFNKFQPTAQSYKFTSHIAAFLSMVLITEMLEICIQTSYDQNVQLILKSYLPVVYGTPLSCCDQFPYYTTVRVLFFVGTNFRGFYKMHRSMGSWICGFKHDRQQSMGKLYFVRLLFSWFKWTTKLAKIRTPRLIIILHYFL